MQSFAWDPSQPRTIFAAIDHDGTVPIVALPINEDGTSQVDQTKIAAIVLTRGGVSAGIQRFAQGRQRGLRPQPGGTAG